MDKNNRCTDSKFVLTMTELRKDAVMATISGTKKEIFVISDESKVELQEIVLNYLEKHHDDGYLKSDNEEEGNNEKRNGNEPKNVEDEDSGEKEIKEECYAPAPITIQGVKRKLLVDAVYGSDSDSSEDDKN